MQSKSFILLFPRAWQYKQTSERNFRRVAQGEKSVDSKHDPARVVIYFFLYCLGYFCELPVRCERKRSRGLPKTCDAEKKSQPSI